MTESFQRGKMLQPFLNIKKKNLAVWFLVSSSIANAFSVTKVTEQAKNKCHEKTFITAKTPCHPCSLNVDIQCPEDFTRITNSSGDQGCRYGGQIRGGSGLSLLGCQHTCKKEYQQLQCCPGYWGPDCLECPGGATAPCNNRGHCSQGITGNGICTCQKGFAGAACEICDKDNLFGPLCISAINPCLEQVCDPHADCIYLEPNRHTCTCWKGYEGDGQVCTATDPCQTKSVYCPTDSTVCKYDGPGKSHCECKEHFSNFVHEEGCSMTDYCTSNNPCHKHATCKMTAPGEMKCACQKGYEGNGFVCYRNIMDQIRDMNSKPGGQWQGKLTSAIQLFEYAYEHQLSTLGPFTVLIPTDKGLKGNHDNMIRLRLQGGKKEGKILEGDIIASNGIVHIIDTALDNMEPAFEENEETSASTTLLTDMSNVTIFEPSRQAIENMDQDEKAVWMSKSNIPALIKYLILDGTYTVADLQNMSLSDDLHDDFLSAPTGNDNLVAGTNIVAGDTVTTNGIVHIINKVLTPRRGVRSTLPKLLTRLEQMPDYTIFKNYIIRFNLAGEIEAAGAYTIFAPDDYAIKNYLESKQLSTLDEGQIRFHILLEEKLFKNDLRNGMFRDTMLGFSFRIGFFIHDAQLYANEAPINKPDIGTENGIIHGLGKVMEIKKNRCDTNETVMIVRSCLPCIFTRGCPPGTTVVEGTREKCFYYKPRERILEKGCRVHCAKTVITRECCAGFYGTQCEPCPQVAGNICSGNGVCLDGFNGTGLCACEPGFKGLVCDSCTESKYGAICDQVCACVHGRCNSDIKGDGSCECDVGWRGVKCDSEIKDDTCNKTCHTSANCLLSPKGASYCKCAAGFKGNGTYCTAIDACEVSNGGCSAVAECRRTTPGNRACVCKTGYTGDGIVCLEINPCITNNGGCDKNAECTHIGPNQAACNCLKGYFGDGNTCTYISLCSTNNGGCGENAICNDTETTERTCTCKPGYIGDGFTCRGSLFQELARNFNTSSFQRDFQNAGVQDLDGPGPFTVFAPYRKASTLKTYSWDRNVMPQMLRYHIVACSALLFDDLTTDKTVTTLQGEQLKITFSQNSVFLNGKAKILTSDIITPNGVIHVIDGWLVPQRIQDFVAPYPSTERESLKIVAAKNGYIMFANLLESAGLFSFLNDPAHQPITLFWPTDQVIRALPEEQKDFLFKMTQAKLQQYLKFYIIRDAKILACDLPTSTLLKTVQGFDLSVTCGNYGNEVGELYLNDRSCKIVQRYLEFDGGVAYGIDCVLTDPNVGGRCDTFVSYDVPGECSSCYRTTKCPAGHKQKGQGSYPCTYSTFGRVREGCQRNCSLVVRVPQCCKGYFGNDCQGCPGGPEAPCNSRGSCDEGYSGTGECTCYGGFNGTACELCLPGRYGSDCRFCQCTEHGQCDEGISGSGLCVCETGWTGKLCETKLDVAPVCSPSCSTDAVCKAPNVCQCKLYYVGDGINCTAINLCKIANGGCHKNARCTQSGVQVNCACQKGYKGDGHVCTAINPCTDGLNGGCHEHAICTATGPGKRKCECKDNYIGDGVNCEVEQLRVNRCSQDNGQCHADAVCIDLHFEDASVGVFHVRSPRGQYKLTYDDANKTCANEGATLATYNQLLYAQKAKYHYCAAGWLQNGRVGYPTAYPAPACGGGLVGIVDYGIKTNRSETWDAFCYRVKDVNCTCKTGYVGDGFTCTGNLLQVLVSVPAFSNFVLEIFTYSNTSRKGQEFLKYLTSLSIKATLFVPDNDGLKENETLSGRDIEYHLSNFSILYYDDLTNGSTLQTRIGKKLLVTHRAVQENQASVVKNKATRYVDGKAILGWDIVASNGVIHVIEGPLKAPPLPPAFLHLGAGTGIFFAVVLIIGIVALVGYAYFRLKQGQIRFHRFKQKNDLDGTTLDIAQTTNISNINYEGSTTSPPDLPYDPFSDSDGRDLVTSGAPADF